MYPPRPAAEGEGRCAIRSPRNAGLNALTWDYRTRWAARTSRTSSEVLQEINGCDADDRQAALPSFAEPEGRRHHRLRLLDLLAASIPTPRRNRANEREPQATTSATAGASPGRTIVRILYNRASARPDGKPWSERKKLVWWDEGEARVDRLRRPDFDEDEASRLRPAAGRERRWTRSRGDKPFIMHPDGVGWLFVASGLKDGPLPTHYEPLESPVRNRALSRAATNPAADWKERPIIAYALARRRALPVCSHDLSADRASHRGRHVAHALAPGRTAAGVVLRDFARTGGRARRRARRAGSPSSTPRGVDRSARAGHAAHAAAMGARAARFIRSACRITGATTAW